METSFALGEIVWGKIKGYPWKPAKIVEIKEETEDKPKKYGLHFIGENSKLILAKKNIAKFSENYNKYSITSKKELSENIKKAKELFDQTNNEKMNNDLINDLSKLKNSLNKKKIKKIEGKAENELIYKICNYLRHLTVVLVKKDKNFNLEKNKEYLCKICKYLSEYKIQEPIEFLKKSNLGRYIKYISSNIQNNEIKQAVDEVYQNLQTQVLNYLSRQK